MNPNDDEIRRILESARTIAVVGASASPDKAAHTIPAMLKDAGYRILPVNPREASLFGERAYPSLDDAPRPIDIVDVFRPAAEAPQVAEAAVRAGAKVLWLQLGIESEEAARIARAGGLTVVMDRCLGATHRAMGIPPRPKGAR